MDLQPVAGFDRGLRRVVRSPSVAGVCLTEFEHVVMVRGLLRAGFVLQLSALHGDHLPRVSLRSGLQPLPHLCGACYVSDSDDGGVVALLDSRAALDLHAVPDGQPMALQWSELRAVHDVRTPRGRQTGAMESARYLCSIFAVVCHPGGEL